MPIDAHTLAKHPWMKYINQEELLKPKPYDDYPKHKLRKMLIEKDEYIKDIMDNICDHPDYDDTIKETEMNLRETIEKEQIDRRKTIDHQAERIGKLEKKVKSQMRIAKSVNAKLQKQIRTMKDDWYDATNKMGQQISDLQKEVNDLKAKRRDGYDVHKQREQDWYSSYMKLKEEKEQLEEELRKKNPVIFQKTYQLQKEEIETQKEIIKQREGYIKHQQTEMKQQESIIEYHELREMYMEKYIQEYGCCHQFREMVEETAHKTGNKKHVGILFDD